ncbi:L,D-transpeptidase [Amycolatopsis sp. WAC 04182]|uniref:L,D-transpeptidase n=1 Tax=Amycolatopsis sp. WAC 04182 TaxID=2203198 RepID=UPI001F32757F|nr:L,D-transpeptidase [Amycolatopsis sp. WAC 04182]
MTEEPFPEDVHSKKLWRKKPHYASDAVSFTRFLAGTGMALLACAFLPLFVTNLVDESGTPLSTGTATTAGHRPVAPPAVSDLASLPKATTFDVINEAPPDLQPSQAPTGHVVHPNRTIPVFSAPGKDAIAALPPTQITSDTWVPVIVEEPGWVQVLLPVRPNGATGWLSTQDDSLEHATSPYLITVERSSFQLSLHHGSRLIGRWTVGVGKPNAETPPGRTFVLASLIDPTQQFSPVILPLGTHSTSLETFGGGPGTTGIHGWPTPNVFGKPSSDGCIRVPADALRLLSTEVPLGTPVLIN